MGIISHKIVNQKRKVNYKIKKPLTILNFLNILIWRLKSYGILAQLGEHLPYKQRVTGSSPVGPIFRFLNDMAE